MPSKKSLMSLSSFVHIARVRHEPAFSHGSQPPSTHETGASEPSVSFRISLTLYSSGFLFRRYPPALSVRALDKPRFRERCHNTFEIFERELFALGNLLERDKSTVLFIFGKIRHDAQGVSAAA